MRIGNELAKAAKNNGICQEWHAQLKSTDDKNKLIDMYIRGIDFCLKHDYPSNDYIRKHFVGSMEPHGIYLDDDIVLTDPRRVVEVGKCTGIVEVGKYNICEVFLKHDSEMCLVVKDNAFVMIDMFDNTKLTLMAGDNSKVVVNKYGGELKYTAYQQSIVKVKEKNKKTY